MDPRHRQFGSQVRSFVYLPSGNEDGKESYLGYFSLTTDYFCMCECPVWHMYTSAILFFSVFIVSCLLLDVIHSFVCMQYVCMPDGLELTTD